MMTISEFNIDDFVLLNKNRVNQRDGGVALYVKRSLQPVDKTPNDSNVEHFCAITNTVQFKVSISVRFRTPSYSCEDEVR